MLYVTNITVTKMIVFSNAYSGSITPKSWVRDITELLKWFMVFLGIIKLTFGALPVSFSNIILARPCFKPTIIVNIWQWWIKQLGHHQIHLPKSANIHFTLELGRIMFSTGTKIQKMEFMLRQTANHLRYFLHLKGFQFRWLKIKGFLYLDNAIF